MLYDPKWEAKTKPSLTGFIAWLETQPADGTYNWADYRNCLVCRYLQSIGYKEPWNQMRYRDAVGKNYMPITFAKPRTYGAALERARAAH